MSDFILIEALEAQCAAQGDKPALVFQGRETSYQKLSDTSNQVAQALLAEGIEPHARIGFMGANSDLYFQLLFGVQKARGVLVGVNSRLAGPEVAYVLNLSLIHI